MSTNASTVNVATLDLDANDDVGFVYMVRPIVEGVVRAVKPAQVYLVKVDNWFGEKWLELSAKMPPFAPARIVGQRVHVRTDEDRYVETDAPPLHIEQVALPQAAVFWWSGASLANSRGALMTYLPTSDAGHSAWYIGFRKASDWIIGTTFGTSRQELSMYAADR